MRNPYKGVVIMLAAAMGACTSPQQAIKTAIDVADYACIIAHADLPDSTAVDAACNINAELDPIVKVLLQDLAMRNNAAAAVKAANCKK